MIDRNGSNRRGKGLSVLGAFLLAMGSAAATASTGPSLSSLDANGDNVVSKDEAKAHPRLSQRFANADWNNDGQVDFSEYARFSATGQ